MVVPRAVVLKFNSAQMLSQPQISDRHKHIFTSRNPNNQRETWGLFLDGTSTFREGASADSHLIQDYADVFVDRIWGRKKKKHGSAVFLNSAVIQNWQRCQYLLALQPFWVSSVKHKKFSHWDLCTTTKDLEYGSYGLYYWHLLSFSVNIWKAAWIFSKISPFLVALMKESLVQ